MKTLTPSLSPVLSHIRAHHKDLTLEYLAGLTENQLLAYCHPYYRTYYAEFFKASIKDSSKSMFSL